MEETWASLQSMDIYQYGGNVGVVVVGMKMDAVIKDAGAIGRLGAVDAA